MTFVRAAKDMGLQLHVTWDACQHTCMAASDDLATPLLLSVRDTKWPANYKELAGVRVIAAGLPCQSTSRAGIQRVRHDSGGLWE
eukprot:6510906-Alexandrium_andersonii.AAC.1